MGLGIRNLFLLVEATVLAITKKQVLTSITEDMQKSEPMCTVGRIVNGAVIMKKHYGGSSKKLKIGLLLI